MQELRERIIAFIKANNLPEDSSQIFMDFYSEKLGAFFVQESLHWDFKAAFPSNSKDDYFAGILRLVCAFHNSYGGIIVFGVDDKSRSPGLNDVSVNVEAFNALIAQKLNIKIECVHRKYQLKVPSGGLSSVDVVLVPKRAAGVPLVRFKNDIGKHRAGTIWGRFGHQVLEVSATELPSLYMSRDDYGVNPSHPHREFAIHRSLPPSPATARHFVGRADLMDTLWEWLILSDSPRIFVCGPGGSGKSTLAHEFARGVAHSGKFIQTSAGIPLDFVTYLSAKETELNPYSGKIQGFEAKDFANTDEMVAKILVHSGFMNVIEVSELSLQQKWSALRELFDSFHGLLVLDDIDALTRRGVDAGMEKMFEITLRAKLGAKVVYTLRNTPSLATSNALEVPGLKYDSEYVPFVDSYARQLGLQPPDASFVAGRLAEASGRYPLVIETILALRRTCSDYKQALGLYEAHKGEQARQYMFQREYERLPTADDRPRLLLAALTHFDSGLGFDELLAILNCEKEQLSDAISTVNEIFLRSSNDGTKFELQPVVRKFVEEKSKHLTRGAKLAARVHWFKSEHAPETPALGILRRQIEALVSRGLYADALKSIQDPDIPPMVTEHPRYKAILANILSLQSPPRISDAREAYVAAWSAGHKDIGMLREWYYLEINGKTNNEQALSICDFVVSDEKFSSSARSEFSSKKGQAYRNLARIFYATNPNDSLENFRKSVECYLSAMKIDNENNIPARKTSEWLYAVFNEYCATMVEYRSESDLIDLVKKLNKSKLHVDGICMQIIKVFSYLLSHVRDAELYRMHSVLQTISKEMHKSQFYSAEVRQKFHEDLGEILAEYDRKIAVI